jgi:hypothetical protein
VAESRPKVKISVGPYQGAIGAVTKTDGRFVTVEFPSFTYTPDGACIPSPITFDVRTLHYLK